MTDAASSGMRRAALWALLGAGSGAVALGLVWAADDAHIPFLYTPGLTLFLAPGLTFGLVVGLALHRVGHARIWQAALFAALSVVAWNAGYSVGVIAAYNWPPVLSQNNESLNFFGVGLTGGFVWGAIQTLPVVFIPVTRRLRLLITLVIAGAVTAGLLLAIAVSTVIDAQWLYLILWTGWYAVYAAMLSTALPLQKPTLTETDP